MVVDRPGPILRGKNSCTFSVWVPMCLCLYACICILSTDTFVNRLKVNIRAVRRRRPNVVVAPAPFS